MLGLGRPRLLPLRCRGARAAEVRRRTEERRGREERHQLPPDALHEEHTGAEETEVNWGTVTKDVKQMQRFL